MLSAACAGGEAETALGEERSGGENTAQVEDARAPADARSLALTVEPVASPAVPGVFPSLTCASDGTPWLAWTAPPPAEQGAPRSVLCAPLAGGELGAPRTIVASPRLLVNWADVPALAVQDDGALVAAWLEIDAQDARRYAARIARSGDGGASWSEARPLASDLSGPEYGFVSLVPLAGGECAAFWLDGRGASGGGHGAMALAAARVRSDGAIEDERMLDERVCDCCPTSALALEDGTLLVAYRDRSADEVRDIALARRPARSGEPAAPDGASAPAAEPDTDGWIAGEIVHADGWRIAGCPVNGPRLAASGRTVALAWFTGADERPRVLLALSRDGGASFGPPVRVDEGRPLGRVDLVLGEDGRALVAWLEPEGQAETSGWCARVVTADGETGAIARIAAAEGSRAEGCLRLVRTRDAVLAAWTDAEASRVALARLAPAR